MQPTPPLNTATTDNNNFAIVGLITTTAMICMTIQPIVAFGLVPLVCVLWVIWAANATVAAEHATEQGMLALMQYKMSVICLMANKMREEAENNKESCKENTTASKESVENNNESTNNTTNENNNESITNENNNESTNNTANENNNDSEINTASAENVKDLAEDHNNRSAATTPKLG